MEYKKAIDVLMDFLKKNKLCSEEKEAVLTAIGVLDWASIGKNRMKSIIKAKKEKIARSIKW